MMFTALVRTVTVPVNTTEWNNSQVGLSVCIWDPQGSVCNTHTSRACNDELDTGIQPPQGGDPTGVSERTAGSHDLEAGAPLP
jgi:hypothetical protein